MIIFMFNKGRERKEVVAGLVEERREGVLCLVVVRNCVWAGDLLNTW